MGSATYWMVPRGLCHVLYEGEFLARGSGAGDIGFIHGREGVVADLVAEAVLLGIGGRIVEAHRELAVLLEGILLQHAIVDVVFGNDGPARFISASTP